MRPVCGVLVCARPLTHVEVRSRGVLDEALHPGHLTQTLQLSPMPAHADVLGLMIAKHF